MQSVPPHHDPAMAATADSRDGLRRTLRAARRALTPAERLARSDRALSHLIRLPAVDRARCLGVYLPLASEVDTWPLIDWALGRGVNVAVPVVQRGAMHFHALQAPLLETALGTVQPSGAPRIPRTRIDALIMPLLGFDDGGQRLGMGGGYYDRYLQAARCRRQPRPLRIGLAFGCQHRSTLPSAPWDIRLHAAVTERGVQRFVQDI